MYKQKLAANLHCRVREWPTPLRARTGGSWLPPLDYDWITGRAYKRGIVALSNTGTDHVAKLGPDRTHRLENEPHRDLDGLENGLLELRMQRVLKGPRIHYMPLPICRPRRQRH